jgi:2-polyprenyl-6-methoxyphenol hydroxylase-like FAD-dependent oxidoreductase
MVSSGRDASRLGVGLVFAADRLTYDRHDVDHLRRIVTDRFAGAGWRTPALLEHLADATDLYFDPLEQIHLPRWSRGRIGLVGDAAWCAGPGGSGTGLAMMGGYVLAAELAKGDHHAALARYQEVLGKAAVRGQYQAKGAGGFLAPATRGAIRRRNLVYRLLSTRLMARPFEKMTGGAANAVTLDAYPRAGDPAPAAAHRRG